MASYQDWTTGLNSCLMHPGVCFFTCLCCPVQVAKNKADLDDRNCTACDILFSFPCQMYFNRQQLRAKYGFEQDTCADCLAVFLCTYCVVCQNAAEITTRETHVASAEMMK